MAADRVPQIDSRLNEIGIREQATQNEQLLVLLAQERLALTHERISLTSPATQPVELDSTIASPVGEIVANSLPEMTLAVAEAYPFRTSRQYLELWRRNMIGNDSDHALKFDERRSIAWVKNIHTSERVLVFSTSDVRVVKAYYLIFRLLNSNIHATRDYILQSSQDTINEFVLQTTPEAEAHGAGANLTQQPTATTAVDGGDDEGGGGVGCRCQCTVM